MRPHEALDWKVTAELYRKSERKYPGNNPKIMYPDFFMLRKVSSCGMIKINNTPAYFNRGGGEKVGIYEIKHGLKSINYVWAELGHWDKIRNKCNTGGIMGPKRINKNDYFDV